MHPSSQPPRLAGARSSIGKAVRHVMALETALNAFLTPRCFCASLHRDSRRDRNTLRAVLTRRVPDIVPILVAEVVHNAHAALVAALAHEPWARLVRRMRTGPGTEEALRALQDLELRLRRAPLVPQIRVVELRHLELEAPGGRVRFRLTALLDEAGYAYRSLLSQAGQLRLASPGEPVFAITVPPGMPLAGRPLVPALMQSLACVQSAIAHLEGTVGTPSANMSE